MAATHYFRVQESPDGAIAVGERTRCQYSMLNKHKTMRVLLLGDYSNVHATLAKGLREEGVDVILASDGDGWKN